MATRERPAPRPGLWAILMAWLWIAAVGMMSVRPISEKSRRVRLRWGLALPRMAGGVAATYYWVGGSGNVSDSAHWSLSSGGAPGAGPPSGDNMILDGSSGTGTVTVDAGVSAQLSLTMGQPGLNVTLAAALDVSTGGVAVNQGTLSTAGFAFSCLSFSQGSAGTVSFGSSAVSIGVGSSQSGTFTLASASSFNAGTSTISLGGLSANSVNTAFTAPSATAFYNVSFVGGGDYDPVCNGCTFNDLSFVATSGSNTQYAMSALTGLTVNGTLTMTGPSASNPLGIRSGANYTYAYWNLNGPVSLTNVNFFNTIFQGSGAPFSGTSLGDGQGNSGITFAASRTLYWVGNGGGWGDPAHWSLTSAGTGGQPAPLAQDDAHIDASSITTTGQTIDCTNGGPGNDSTRWLCRDLILTGLAQATTIKLPNVTASTWASFGNITGSSNATLTAAANNEWSFRDQRSPSTITCNGMTIPGSVRISLSTIANILQLGGAATFSGKILGNGGTFKTNGYALSCGGLLASAADRVGFDLTGSTVTLTTGTFDASGGITVTGASTCNLNLTAPNPTALLAGLSWGALSIAPTATGTVFIGNDSKTVWNTTGSTVSSLSFTTPAVTTEQLTMASDLTVTGAITLSGNSATNRLLWDTITLGQAAVISAASITTLANVDFRDIHATGAAGTWAATSGTLGDCQGNSGITFDASIATSYVGSVANGANPTWITAANWSSGRVPLPQDDVTIGGNWGTSNTFNLNAPRLCRNLSLSGMTGNKVRFTNNNNSGLGNSVYGSLTLSAQIVGATAGASFAVAADINLRDRRGGSTVTWAGVQPAGTGATVRIAAPGGDYTFQDVLAVSAATKSLTVDAGTLHLNDLSHTIGLFASTGSVARSLDRGTGTLTVSGTGTVWNASAGLTVTGTGIIDLTDSSAATKTFAGGGVSYPGTVRYRSTGSGGLAITGRNQFVNLDVECTTARTLTLPSYSAQIVTGTLTTQGASGQSLSLVSSVPGTPTFIGLARTATVSKTFVSQSADVLITTNAGFPARTAV